MAEAQLPLLFPHRPGLTAADFLPHAGNALALDFLGATTAWPGGRLVLWGGQGSGKTHLLHIWAADHGAALIAGPRLREPFWPEGAVAIDEFDRVASEPALLHLINAAAEAARPVLLAGTVPPSRLRYRLPDLASRLRAVTAIEIGDPDDAFLASLLDRLLADRQLLVRAEVKNWVLHRLPRTPAIIREAAARLDYAALVAKKSVTRALAEHALADLLGPEFHPSEPVTETSP